MKAYREGKRSGDRIKLSQMRVGERGYLPSEGAVVRLINHASDGLVLVFDEWGRDDVATIIPDVDTDKVAGVDV